MVDRFTRWVVEHRLWVLVGAAVLTATLAYPILGVQINADFSTYLAGDDPMVAEFKQVAERFGSNAVGMVVLADPPPFTPEGLERIRRLTAAFEDVPGVQYVTSLTNVLDVRNTETGVAVGPLLPENAGPLSVSELARLKARLLSEDRYRGMLVSADGSTSLILVGMQPGIQHVTVASDLQRAAEVELGTLDGVHFAGMPFLIASMAELILGNLALLVPLIGLLMVGVLWLGFRRWTGVVMPLLVVVLATVWTVGALALLGRPLDLLTGIMPIILIAMGTADGIHLVRRFYEARSQGRGAREAAVETVRELTGPMVVTTLTTMTGFASLLVSGFDVIRGFGLATAAGVFLALVATFLVLPPSLVAAEGASEGRPRRRSKRDKGRGEDAAAARRALREGRGPWIQGVARLLVRRRAWWLGLAGVVVLAAGAGVPLIRTSVDWSLCLARGSKPWQAEMLLRDRYGGSLPTSIRVVGDLNRPEIFAQISELEKRLALVPELSQPASITGIIRGLNEAVTGSYGLPASPARLGSLWFLLEGQPGLNQLVTADRSEALVNANVRSMETGVFQRAVTAVEEAAAGTPAFARVTLAGLTPEDRLRARAAAAEQAATWVSLDLAQEGIEVPPEALARALQGAEQGPEWSARVRETAVQATLRYLDGPDAEVGGLSAPQALRVADLVGRETLRAPDEAGARTPGAETLQARLETGLEPILPATDPLTRSWLAESLTARAQDAVAQARSAAWFEAVSSMAGGRLGGLDLLGSAGASDGGDRAARQAEGRLDRLVRGDLATFAGDQVLLSDAVWPAGGTGAQMSQTGLTAILQRMDEELTPSQVKSVLLAAGIITLIMMVLFRSWLLGLVALVPTVLTILINFAMMGYFGIGLDSFTAMIANIAIGLGVDYAVHVIWRMRRELAHGLSMEEALARTLQTTGGAVLINAFSVGLGFAVLVAAGGQHVRRLGGLVALTLFVSALLSVTVLPALLSLVQGRLHPSSGAGARPGASRFDGPVRRGPRLQQEARMMKDTVRSRKPSSQWGALGMGLVLTVVLAMGVATAQQTPDPERLLAKADAALALSGSRQFVERLQVIGADGTRKEYALRVYMLDGRMAGKVLEPPEAAGVSFLAEDGSMLLYLPGYDQVRELSGAAGQDPFLGSDFSYDDLRELSWSTRYRAADVAKSEGGWWLELTPRQPGGPYDRLAMEVDPEGVPLEVRYFHGEDEVRRLTFSEIEQIDGRAMPTRMEMTTLATGQTTVLRIEQIESRTYPPGFFSRRGLRRLP